MSIKLMSEAWEKAPYEGAVLLILLALADFSNDDGECWPSVATLAKRARCTRRWTQRVLRQFEDDGWLVVKERKGTSSIYVLTIPQGAKPRPRVYSIPG